MRILGKVIDTFSATKEQSSLPRPKVESLNLIKDYGIEFDKFAGKKLDQTVMIVITQRIALGIMIGHNIPLKTP